jgi:von Willebrand factor type A domain
MTVIRRRRFLVAGGIIGLAAIFTFTQYLVGEPAREAPKPLTGQPAKAVKDRDPVVQELLNRFTDSPLIIYQPKEGDRLFALQVKPDLPAAANRPCDYIIVVPTTASQGRGHFQATQKMVEGFVGKLGADDRVALRTVNVKSADLSDGFKAPKEFGKALKALAGEVPMGAPDLKTALNKALESFEAGNDRQKVILFLGDGKSILNPFGPGEINALAEKMVKDRVAFFPVPMGVTPDAALLNGLSTGTGGAAIRLNAKDDVNTFVKKARETISAPILYSEALQLPAEVTEVLPAKLPPIRTDAPTLVVGKMKPLAKLNFTVKGTVEGKPFAQTKELPVPAAELDHYFLASVIKQWEADKDHPALIRGDHALAFAATQNEGARGDLLMQGRLAIQAGRLDLAERLLTQADELDPAHAETKAMLGLLRDLRDGKVTREEIRDKIRKDLEKGAKAVGVPMENALARADDKPVDKPGAGQPPLAPPDANPDLIEEAKRRQEIIDQRARLDVDRALREALRTLPSNPENAYQYLRDVFTTVENDPTLSETTKRDLLGKLRSNLRAADVRRGEYARDVADRQKFAVIAANQERILNETRATNMMVEERVRQFHYYLDRAREREASEMALALRSSLVENGLPIPPSVEIMNFMATARANIREMRELRMERERRFVASRMTTERLLIPPSGEDNYVEYPTTFDLKRRNFDKLPRFRDGKTPLNWLTFSEYRKEKWESYGIGDSGESEEVAEWRNRTLRIMYRPAQDLIEEAMQDPKNNPELLKGLMTLITGGVPKTFTLQALKEDYIDKVITPALHIPIWINTDAFGGDPDKVMALATNGNLASMPRSTTLAIWLDRLLALYNPRATWVMRRNFIEITTIERTASEMTVRLHPLGDLAVIYGPTLFAPIGMNGQIGGIPIQGGIGGFGGQIGGFGGQIGGFGGINGFPIGGQIGGFGGGQAVGAIGGQLAGVNVGALREPFIQVLIKEQIGGREMWGNDPLTNITRQPGQEDPNAGPGPKYQMMMFPPQGQTLGGALGGIGGINGIGTIGGQISGLGSISGQIGGTQLNTLNLGLMVRAPSRRFARLDPPLIDKPGGGGGANNQGALPNPGDRQFAVNGPDRKPVFAAPAVKLDDLDPKTTWEKALAKGIDHPGLIVECAEVMANAHRFDHVVELLKANLRQGIYVEPWVYQALAVALRETRASAEEIERAEVSAVDLEPMNPEAFLSAAKGMDELKRPERALALCRQAALLQPNAPEAYSSALVYAGKAKDRDGLAWAAENLLARDWPEDNVTLHIQAESQVRAEAEEIQKKGGEKADADKLLATLNRKQRRDFEVRLVWDGQARLDLKVKEPTGSVCTWLNRQSVGGGTLVDEVSLTPNAPSSMSYVCAEAFSGAYEFTVEPLWGTPLRNKAQLRVTYHKGTPEQREEILTVDLTQGGTVKVNLQDGRRKEVASVPPRAPVQLEEPRGTGTAQGESALGQLRDLANPSASVAKGTPQAAVAGMGRPAGTATAVRPPQRSANDQLLFQERVTPFNSRGVDLVAQAELTSDGQFVRLSVNPVFAPGAGKDGPLVETPVIPGARP